MKNCIFTVNENINIAKDVYKMTLSGDTSDIVFPGQFVNIALSGKFLRRPISVCDVNGNELTLIYKVVGGGTEQLSKMTGREKLDILSGLGNGYDINVPGKRMLLCGGGVGIPPLYLLAKRLIAAGAECICAFGFADKCDVFYTDEFKKLGCEVNIATVSGALGTKGFVTDIFPEEYDYVFTCGPEPMLKAVYKKSKTGGQFSFEARMGCGFGACMGCSCKTIAGAKRICKDGPVLKKEEILWED
ncbi:MAG: dihydroorotate dehydrogenase electron transfer subunit [Clostridia bacterium]|nr:dihydroorotate dehydrogenase electron transfer subunit [Clostridia bacterium]